MTIKALELLASTKLYTTENQRRIREYPQPMFIAHGLSHLIENKLLSQENFDLIVAHDNPRLIAQTLTILDKNHLLTRDRRHSITKHESPEFLAKIWVILTQAGLLNSENEAKVTLLPHLANVYNALDILFQKELLTPIVFERCLAHKYPLEFASGYTRLKNSAFFESTFIDLLGVHGSPDSLALSLVCLHKTGIFDKDKLDTLVKLSNIDDFAIVFHILSQASLLNDNSYSFLLSETKKIKKMAWLLSLLHEKGALTRKNFNAIRLHVRWGQLSDLLKIILMLDEVEILNKDNISILITEIKLEISTILGAFSRLHSLGILNQLYFEHTIKHKVPHILASALAFLHSNGRLNSENFRIVTHHSMTCLSYALFYLLQESSLLNKENEDKMNRLDDLENLFEGLYSLTMKGIQLNQDIYNAMVDNPYPLLFSSALNNLHQAGILSSDNITRLQTYEQHMDFLAESLDYLFQTSILNQDNFETLCGHPYPRTLANLFEAMISISYLTQDTFNTLTTHTQLKNLNNMINLLEDARLLSIANVEALFQPHHQALASDFAIVNLWFYLPTLRLTQDVFREMLIAAEQPYPQRAFLNLRNQLMDDTDDEDLINPQQSTHSISVHRTVSESARKLMDSYGDDLKLDSSIENLKLLVHQFETSPKQEAAKRCLDRITQVTYTFTDPQSLISTRELLALVYHALHDDLKRQGNLHDALTLIIEGLYECQRGYNLDAEGHDLGGADSPVCIAGTFNKIIEKLHGVHADVHLEFITHEIAATKFPKLAQNFVINYLIARCNPQSLEEYRAINILIAKLKDDKSIGLIWDEIKPELEDALWHEFHEAYEENRDHPNFKALIDNGASINLPELEDLEQQLERSPGYRAYLALKQAQLEISQFSLFIGHERERLESDRTAKRQCLV